MTRNEFAHTVRAAATVLNVKDVLVIGSQAVHASVDDVFEAVHQSIETDIASFHDDDGRKADLIDGTIGEASMFQETYGYYAQGVTSATAILPEGWRDRLVRFTTPENGDIVAHCLELHDLWISKAMAGRQKDQVFCRELLRRRLVQREILRERLALVHGQPAEKTALANRWIGPEA